MSDNQPPVVLAGSTAYIPQPQYPPPQYPPPQYPPSQYPPSQYPPPQYPSQQYTPSSYNNFQIQQPENLPNHNREKFRASYKSQLVFSIVNAICFIFLFFLWIPALWNAFKARRLYHQGEYIESSKAASKARGFNFACLVIGVIIYVILVSVLVPILIMNNTTTTYRATTTTYRRTVRRSRSY